MGKIKFAKDPLPEILERHLFQASTENVNSQTVVDSVVSDYVRLLYTQGVHIPQSVQKYFIQDIKEEIKELLIKKTHATVPCDVNSKVSEFALSFRKVS